MGIAWLQLKDAAGNRRTYSIEVPESLGAAAQAFSAASAALTAAIRFAGTAQGQASAAAAFDITLGLAAGVQGIAWIQLKDAAGNRRTYQKLVTRVGAKGQSSASAALTTQPRLAGNAVDVVSANAGLTNWQTVVLAAPLYTGENSILDSRHWVGAAPAAGHQLAYDATYMTILPSGEIEATSNNFAAIVQYNNGSGWQTGLVIILPTAMVGFAAAQSSATGALAGGSTALAAAAVDVAAAAGALLTAILLRFNAVAQAQATGAITALIRLMAGATAHSSASASLAGVPIALAGDAMSSASAAGDPITQIRLAAQSLVAAAASAGLLTGHNFRADAQSAASAYADLMARINFQADAKSEAAADLKLIALGPVVKAPLGTANQSLSRRPRVLH